MFWSLFASSALLAGAVPLSAATPARAGLSQRIAQAESELRARLASDPVHAPQLRLAMARIAALRSSTASIRHGQGGVLSTGQQDRALSRLDAIESAMIQDTPR